MEIREILRDILRRGDHVLGETQDTDPNYGFLHTIVNYARAKRESEGAIARLRDAVSFEKQKPLREVNEGEILAKFVDLLQRRFKINAQRANDLFTVLRQDADSD